MMYATGRYHSLPGTQGHRITIANNAGIYDASRACWHELTHAAQAERHGRLGFQYLYTRQLEHIGLQNSSLAYGKPIDEQYAMIPFEQEADWMEDRMYRKYGNLFMKKENN